MKYILFSLLLGLPLFSHAQNYKLEKTSDLLQGCSFIHKDEYNFSSTITLIQELLKTKFEGDEACSAPLAQLNSQMLEVDQYLNRRVTQQEKVELSKSAQKQYLLELESEMTLLDPQDPAQALRLSNLQMLSDSVKAQLTTLGVESHLASYDDQATKENILAQKWEHVYANSSAAISTINALPDNCIDRLGGWKNMIPVVMKLAGTAGPFVGGPVGAVITAAFETGGQIAALLRNSRVKRAIADNLRVQNSQIIACTYTLLQTNACELKRVKDLMDDKEKILNLINARVSDSKSAEYEAYFLQVRRLPGIKKVFNDVGSMGSALTLDLELLAKYFNAVRLAPGQITEAEIPQPEDSDAVKTEFLIKMKARGLEWQAYTMEGPADLDNQIKQVRTLIEAAKGIIDATVTIMTAKRSFNNLKSEIIKSNQYVIKEIRAHLKMTKTYLDSPDLPIQYRADFKSNEITLTTLLNFIDYNYVGDSTEKYYEYLKEVDTRGAAFFDEMSRGSIAQITEQTVLMIPEIAFERFIRPFNHLEKHYITQDIIRKDDPTHSSYTDFVITRSVQSKFENYPVFFGSSAAFRIETYESAKKSMDTGFKKEIIRMVKDSMKARSEILQKFEGKTPAHLCALYSSFLKDNSPALFKKCQKEYTQLGLYPILTEANRPTNMTIDYHDPCFYNDYIQEEEGQRRLYEKLIDYGSRNNLTF